MIHLVIPTGKRQPQGLLVPGFDGFGLSAKDALSGIDRIRDTKQKQAETLMDAAQKYLEAGKFSDCAAQLSSKRLSKSAPTGLWRCIMISFSAIKS